MFWASPGPECQPVGMQGRAVSVGVTINVGMEWPLTGSGAGKTGRAIPEGHVRASSDIKYQRCQRTRPCPQETDGLPWETPADPSESKVIRQ